ncbi:MAG TPA: inactive serine/threonine-protein kinase VRK3 [Rhodocyclaceae bacterium]|nr:inactive serine/threonine-protein kinase VRK3 [Rhodocyclaceae bacterium]
MDGEYFRPCPTCGAEHAPAVMRCTCGALLMGVDLVRREAAARPAEASAAVAIPAAEAVCPHDDCGQPNPPGSTTCLYCNRSLAPATAPAQGLVALPTDLRSRYRILRPLPAAGAEADLLLVESLDGSPVRVAKLYRLGLTPRPEVGERLARIDRRYRVELLESGLSDGRAWEVMEYCSHGSLRERLAAGQLAGEALQAVIRQLVAALAAVHAAGLVHRDIKPENILIRSAEPLELVLADFGIASVLEATQCFTGVARSLHYGAPESLSGVIDAKADHWALGMILLEAALGQHPFAGLSEAVILHHLATRAMDLSAVDQKPLRKLLAGLLQRDPKVRWGQAEVGRWLAGDPTLPDPRADAPAESFAEPYRLAGELCWTSAQLAVALARHWREGVADLGNGQLLAWFRGVQKDHDTVRLLIEMQQERQLHVDVQLLRLMLHLAPGIPPVWRGESIELPALLARAGQALGGDRDAAAWLDALYRHRVLEAYAAAGNPEMAAIVDAWTAAAERFGAAWEARVAWLKDKTSARQPGEVVLFDDLMYGRGPSRPPSLDLNPRLLALAYDPAWSAGLRRRLGAELAGLQVHCPWLADFGDPESLDPASLLVLEALLPEARQAAERQRKARAAEAQGAAAECRQLRGELEAILPNLRRLAGGGLYNQEDAVELAAELDRYGELLAKVRASGRNDGEWQELRKAALKAEPAALRLAFLADRLSQRLAVDGGWLSLPVAGFFLAGLVFLPQVAGGWTAAIMVAAAVAVVAWRVVPTYSLRQRIREAAQNL